jgi:hypothetical protein
LQHAGGGEHRQVDGGGAAGRGEGEQGDGGREDAPGDPSGTGRVLFAFFAAMAELVV